MKKTELRNFSITMLGNGKYKITYKHPVTRKSWAMITDSKYPLETLMEPKPLGKDLHGVLMAIRAYENSEMRSIRRAVIDHFCNMRVNSLASLTINLMKDEQISEYYIENLIDENG